MIKVGVYVGSFDPIHKGHIGIMNYLIKNRYVDKIILIPTGGYWNKVKMIDKEYRINMCKKYENDKICVNDKLNDLPYSYMILDELKKVNSNYQLYLIIGADNMIDFYKWECVDKILENNILVIPRDNIEIDKYILDNGKKDKFIIVDGFRMMDISSSNVRRLIKDNNYEEVLKFIDKEILEFIILNKLYV